MKRQLTIGGLAAVLGISLLMLNGCSDSPHKPLKRLYYGYYKDKPKSQFTIIAFDKHHPSRVAVRNNYGSLRINKNFPVQYTHDTVIIKTDGKPVKLKISGDTRRLTCANCAHKTIPKTYNVGMYQGKPFKTKVGTTAYKTITYQAKQNGGYKYLS